MNQQLEIGITVPELTGLLAARVERDRIVGEISSKCGKTICEQFISACAEVALLERQELERQLANRK